MNNRLRELRDARGWSQGELAERLVVSRQTVNALETGKYDPSLPLAFRIARLFGLRIEDVFLPARRTMVHAGVPLDNQWSRWAGTTYALPTQAWVGPHHSAVITGLARAGIEALIELAAEKTPRGRTARLCDNPQVQDAVGRADAILNAGGVDTRIQWVVRGADDSGNAEHKACEVLVVKP